MNKYGLDAASLYEMNILNRRNEECLDLTYRQVDDIINYLFEKFDLSVDYWAFREGENIWDHISGSGYHQRIEYITVWLQSKNGASFSPFKFADSFQNSFEYKGGLLSIPYRWLYEDYKREIDLIVKS